MGQDKSKPHPGDLIEIDRRFHQHWALYLGDGDVIHLTPVDKRKEQLGVHKVPVFTRTVKKQLLKEVVGNKKWRVNNKSDRKHTPLPVQVILLRAVAYIGEEIKYRSFGSNCERFVKRLRYGDQLAFIDGEIHILDKRDNEEYPKPGDLIEIKQEYDNQWAIYMGDGYVIYVAPVGKGVPSVSGTRDTVLIRKAKVKKELLKKMVGNKKWRVNKEYDCQSTPLPVQEIIWHAEGCIGKEMEYDERKFKSVEFLSKLRHGGQWSAFQAAGICRHDEIDSKYLPIPGDLIEIERTGYQHWALCLGRGYVIHVTDRDENSLPMSVGSMSVFTRSAMVKKQLLEEVAGNDEWCVNNKYDEYRNPFPVEEIIRRAERQINIKVHYRLFNKNCEHFVTKLRYGQAVSEQASKAAGTGHGLSSAVTVLGSVPLLLASNIPSVGVAGVMVGAATTVGFAFNNIVQNIKGVKFRKQGRDILEQRCC